MGRPGPNDVMIEGGCFRKWGQNEVPPEVAANGLTDEEWQRMRNIVMSHTKKALIIAGVVQAVWAISFLILALSLSSSLWSLQAIAGGVWGIAIGTAMSMSASRLNAEFLRPKKMLLRCSCCTQWIVLPSGGAPEPALVGNESA
eukprot:NODE_17605_length_934_cov_6.247831.p2 GENE.NODE_17605_length_934_cov_6.247831~~NODE_17605_length_934_cov_6.247831.p2  ORF type:complete len:144 (-),score=29.37 NODE_17605_length_934_cov_6.247831:385-816(-)